MDKIQAPKTKLPDPYGQLPRVVLGQATVWRSMVENAAHPSDVADAVGQPVVHTLSISADQPRSVTGSQDNPPSPPELPGTNVPAFIARGGATRPARQRAPSVPAAGEEIPLEAPDAHGFIFPDRLQAQLYLSQLQSDSVDIRQSPGIEPTSQDAAEQFLGATLDTATLQAAKVVPSNALPSRVITIGGDSAHVPYGGQHDFIQTDDAGNAGMGSAMSSGISDWLKKNFAIVEKQGHLQVWMRDYHLKRHDENVLVERLLLDAQQAGRRIISITLNGRSLWQRSDQPPAPMRSAEP